MCTPVSARDQVPVTRHKYEGIFLRTERGMGDMSSPPWVPVAILAINFLKHPTPLCTIHILPLKLFDRRKIFMYATHNRSCSYCHTNPLILLRVLPSKKQKPRSENTFLLWQQIALSTIYSQNFGDHLDADKTPQQYATDADKTSE
ncbi:hypothetical protein PIB30_064631 [Stylosanthes scabra]|uniref:Uncharacterized protein n=1 Tax=Stylosanthes scabra TaxID=79078 RepID=A0ABU6VMS4_9FABA|nr:hypothetical protein [Stylosanthes scabra]